MIINQNSIKSKYIKIYELQTKKIGIPIFQRFYDWKEKQIVQFKDDILKSIEEKDKEFYLLDFICYYENNRVMIADGQQRLVTLNNLIKAIKDVSQANCITIDDIELFDIEYDVYPNQEKYEKHMKKYASTPFKKVYIDLYNFVSDNLDKINDVIELIKNKIFIYIKECESSEDAFNIFQQINTGGKPLTKDEVVKTAIDQYSQAYQVLFDTTKVKEVMQSLQSFYKFKMSSFDKKFDNMEIITFLRDFVTKDKKTFQEFVDSVKLLKDFEKSPIKYVVEYINRSTLHDVLNILIIKGININTDQDYLSNVVIPLCMISIVFTLKGGNPSRFKTLLQDVIKQLKNNDNPEIINHNLITTVNSNFGIWKIKKSEFVEKLGDLSVSRNMKKALLILDVMCKNISGTLNVNSINLEHIYPQTPNYVWAQNGWPTHTNDQRPLIDNIGNYMLLCESVNKSIQNQYITNKVAKYNAIMKKDIILQVPANTVDFEKFENDRENYIFERQKEIANHLINDLPLGKVLINN